MKITLFEINDNELNKLNVFLEGKEINETTFIPLLKNINVSISIEYCSRLLSHHICESLDSYTQQSQRYVKMGSDAFVIPKELEQNPELKQEFVDLNIDLFNFYTKITQTKEGFSGRKASESDYLYGIKIEDGRYVLPLATKTNILITMNFSKIINFYRTIKKINTIEGKILLNEINEKIKAKKIIELINKFSEEKINEETISDYMQETYDKLNAKNNCVLLDKFNEPLIRTGLGALTSTNQRGASEIKKEWDEENKTMEKAQGVTQRVISYGHTSIIEHARTNFGLIMSLTCYHQFERHRLPNNIREQYSKINIDREVIIPPSVQKNKEVFDEFNEKIQKVKNFRKKLKENNYPQEYLLLNCDMIKVISSTNARIDNDILSERTCNNAQWEIRDLYNKKLDILKQLGPVLYDHAGPPCTRGPCPEGNLSCGKIIQMREKYGYFGN